MTPAEQLTLAGFLLARIAEDERVAREASAGGRWRYENGDSVGAWTLYDEHWNIATLSTYPRGEYDYAERMPAFRPPYYVDADANGAHIARHDPARVLADCEARRRIVAWYESVGERIDDAPALEPRRNELGMVLRALTLPFADHPDYDPAWRP